MFVYNKIIASVLGLFGWHFSSSFGNLVWYCNLKNRLLEQHPNTTSSGGFVQRLQVKTPFRALFPKVSWDLLLETEPPFALVKRKNVQTNVALLTTSLIHLQCVAPYSWRFIMHEYLPHPWISALVRPCVSHVSSRTDPPIGKKSMDEAIDATPIRVTCVSR